MPRSSRASRVARPSRSRFSFYNLSTETLASMVWLDPAPMPISEPIAEDPEEEQVTAPQEDQQTSKIATEKDLLDLPVPTDNRPNLIYYMTRIQRYSSYTFFVFVSIHFTNTSIIPLIVKTVSASETYLFQARELYQTPLTESLLVGLPIIAHVGAGVALRFLRHAQNLRRYGGEAPEIGTGVRRHKANLWPALNWISLSGYVYGGFLGAHVFLNRVLPMIVDGDSSNIGLSYVSYIFVRYPKISWIMYSGLVIVGCSHMVWGIAKWLAVAPMGMGWSGRSRTPKNKTTVRRNQRIWNGLHMISIGVSVFWMTCGVQYFASEGISKGWISLAYDKILSQIQL